MIVLAESNFVLELALRQEQFEDAERILRMAEEHELQLLVPAYSLTEPYQTLIRRRSERKEFKHRLLVEITLLERSRLHAEIGGTAQAVARTLDVGTDIERKSFEKTVDRLTQICLIQDVSRDIIRLSQTMQLEFRLDPQDALVMASIDTALQAMGVGPKVFVNKNSRDFAIPIIEKRLERFECRLITAFSDARQYIESELNKKAN